MSSFPEKVLHSLVWKYAREWARHPEFDDILSETYVAAWMAVQRAEKNGGSPFHWAELAARHGASRWFRKWYGRPEDPVNGPSKRALAKQYSLEAMEEEDMPTAVEFEGISLTRVEAARLWRKAREVCTPRQQQILCMVLLEEKSFRECERELSISNQSLHQSYRNGIKRLQSALGLPE